MRSTAVDNVTAPGETLAAEDSPASATITPSPAGQDGTRINLLFIIDQLGTPGGAERMLLKTIAALPKDRFDCRLVTFKHNPEVEIFRNVSCPLHVLPLRRTYDLNALKVALQIRRLVRDHRIDIVHTFHETSDLWAGVIAKASGCPVLISSRRDMGYLRTRKHQLGYALLRPCFDKVLSVSEQVRQHCITVDGFDPGKVRTLYNGIDLAPVDAARADSACRRSLGISEQVPLITTVGNIRRIKGLDLLVRAAERVCRRYPAATFLVAGERPQDDYSEELERLVKSLNLARNVIFAGSREDVLSILKTSDIFCLPSRSEGFSNALIEAMACALPCVATDAGGNSEALIDGLNGHLVQPEDPALLADSIVRLLDSPAMARELGLAARRTVEERFTFSVMIEHLMHLYADLACSRRLDPVRPGKNTHQVAERH